MSLLWHVDSMLLMCVCARYCSRLLWSMSNFQIWLWGLSIHGGKGDNSPSILHCSKQGDEIFKLILFKGSSMRSIHLIGFNDFSNSALLYLWTWRPQWYYFLSHWWPDWYRDIHVYISLCNLIIFITTLINDDHRHWGFLNVYDDSPFIAR